MANKGTDFVWAKEDLTGKLVKLEFEAGTATLVRIRRYKAQSDTVLANAPTVLETLRSRGLTGTN
jgi:hypothetical protein